MRLNENCEQRRRGDGFGWLDERRPSGLTRLQEAEAIVGPEESARVRVSIDADQLIAEWLEERSFCFNPDDPAAFETVFGPLFAPLREACAERDFYRDEIRRGFKRLARLDHKMRQVIRREEAAARERARLDTAALVLALADADPGSDPIVVVAKWLGGREAADARP